jgi:hypothetical protein
MTLTIELPLELEERLAQEAARNGQAAPDYARMILAALLKQLPDRPTPSGGEANPRPIWQVAAEIMQGVPEDELERLPVDLSENLDHYLYGAPKKQEGPE